MGKNQLVLQPGLIYLPGYFSAEAQKDLIALLDRTARTHSLFTPTMPRTGKPMSVKMLNFGPLGWVTDKERGYRYQATHPETGKPWPDMPETVLDLWRDVANKEILPEACLLNHYVISAKMGLHQDRDEADFSLPVVSVSLGDVGVFRYKGESRSGPSRSLKLNSGDVVVMGGESRLCYHGIDRIIAGSSPLLAGTVFEAGRINLTLRRVTKP